MAHHLIYGGTFDPIHHGHLIVCRRAREILGADRVVLVPARVSPHKSEEEGMGRATGEQRVEMIRLAIEGEGDFLVDGRELQRAGPSFTFDTITEMTAEKGTAPVGMRLMTLLIGADQMAKLHMWHRVEELLGRVEMGVLPRPGVDVAAGMRAVRDGLGEAAVRRLVVLETPLIEISATEIRRRVGARLGESYCVPRAVAEFIAKQRLYRA